jgi:hypothetical protein
MSYSIERLRPLARQLKILMPASFDFCTPGRTLTQIEDALGLVAMPFDQFGVRLTRCEKVISSLKVDPGMQLILFSGMYSPGLLRANPKLVFLFGDNCKRVGKGGQAIIRDEPNALGVATKRTPAEYFEDGNVRDLQHMLRDLVNVEDQIKTKQVVIPITTEQRISLGCGLSNLPYYSPSAYAFLERWFEKMKREHTFTPN